MKKLILLVVMGQLLGCGKAVQYNRPDPDLFDAKAEGDQLNDDLVDLTQYPVYSSGDQVAFAGQTWYVIKDSPATADYLTLIRSKALSDKEIKKYGDKYADDDSDEMYPYFIDGSSREFDNTVPKYILDKYSVSLGVENLKKQTATKYA